MLSGDDINEQERHLYPRWVPATVEELWKKRAGKVYIQQPYPDELYFRKNEKPRKGERIFRGDTLVGQIAWLQEEDVKVFVYSTREVEDIPVDLFQDNHRTDWRGRKWLFSEQDLSWL